MDLCFQKKIPVILLVIQFLLRPHFAVTAGITSITDRMLNNTGAMGTGGTMRYERDFPLVVSHLGSFK
jgi:hypothetical protein